ncbi:ras-related protein Rab-13-like isoform X2 [Liolophura sinensis]|uniref:ras-related protein Rab-13-like isoform X2 n=1 Tax=Liolophura sinensis TaxID=3198878 RepID=UPI0031592D9C
MSRRYDILMRLLLVGDTGVGKTCLLCRYANDEFFDTHISTIGIDFKMKTVAVDGRTVKVQIWDTAGQERFESITKQFYRRAEGILLVFDITNKASFEGVGKWITYIRELTREDPVMMLLGNKSDRKHRRQVSFAQAKEFAENYDMKYSETSAKSADNINQAFLSIITDVLRSTNAKTDKQNNRIENHSSGGAGEVLTDRAPLLARGSRSSSRDEEAVDERGQSRWCCSLS